MLLITFALLISGCGVSIYVSVSVARPGTGSVSVLARFQHSTAMGIEDLKGGLPLGDLKAAGWRVAGPAAGPGGTMQVRVSHRFSSLSQLPTLMADIAGTGPPGGRPFRLRVSEKRGALRDSFSASGQVDLSCGLSCFDDAKLAKDVGQPLGLSAQQLRQALGPSPAKQLRFYFQLSLPGQVQTSNAASQSRGGGLVWATPLGQGTDLVATSESVDHTLVDELVGAGAVAVFVVGATALVLLWRRHRRAEAVTRPR